MTLRGNLAERVATLVPGMTPLTWLRMLGENRGRIDLRNLPRGLMTSALTLPNLVQALTERAVYGRALRRVRVGDPLIVVGHFRSGTTLLYRLLAATGRFAFPTTLQTIFPHGFLLWEPVLSRVFGQAFPETRPVDMAESGADVPEEDEYALATLSGISPYLGWCWPRRAEHYRRHFALRDLEPGELERWRRAVDLFARKLTLGSRAGPRGNPRPLLLKSPPHTARMARLREIFPTARFLHIHRHPVEVFASTRWLLRVSRRLAFQEVGEGEIDEQVLADGEALFDAFFEDRQRLGSDLGPGSFCEVSFRELIRDPLPTLARIYAAFDLGDFTADRPLFETFLAAERRRGFRMNRYPPLTAEEHRRLEARWGRCFAAWGGATIV